MSLRHIASTLTILAALSAGLTGCDADGDAEATPSSSSPSEPTASEPTPSATEAGGPPAGWQDKFTREQLNTYHAALGRWEQFTKLANEIYREGKDTSQARDTLKEYHLFWQREIVILAETYDQGGLRLEVPDEPLWAYATAVKPDYVVIVQCTDYSKIKYTKNGDVLDNKPEHLVTPLVIRMGKPKGRDWMFESSTLRDKRSCSA